MKSIHQKTDLDQIGQKVIEFKSNPSHTLKSIIIERISLYIRNYPTLAFRIRDDDLKSDFYLYVIERIDAILENYNPEVGRFITYFSIRLRTYYINFINQKNTRQQYDLSAKSKPAEDDQLDYFSVADYNLNQENEQTTNQYRNQFEKLILNNIPDFEKDPLHYLTMKLFLFDFFDDQDFIKLKIYTSKPYGTLLSDIEMIREDILKKKTDQLLLEEKLQKVFYEMIDIDIDIDTEDELSSYKKLTQKRSKILERFYQINITPTVKLIADTLSLPLSKINNILSYQKKNLKLIKTNSEPTQN